MAHERIHALLAAFTHLPRHRWALIWAAGTVLALFAGGSWLMLGR